MSDCRIVTACNVEEVAKWAGCGYWGPPGPPRVWLLDSDGEPTIMAKPGDLVVRTSTGRFVLA